MVFTQVAVQSGMGMPGEGESISRPNMKPLRWCSQSLYDPPPPKPAPGGAGDDTVDSRGRYLYMGDLLKLESCVPLAPPPNQWYQPASSVSLRR